MSGLRRIAVRVPEGEAEPVRARFLELSPVGFEEVEVDGVTVELAVYADSDHAAELLAGLPGATVKQVAEGWEDAWRDFHRPVVAGGLWIGPPWETPPDPSRAVVIDPGRAFGTGAHPTTHLSVDLLANAATRGSLLDVGCGSGVVAIAAARLGFAPVYAVDLDPVAIEVTRASARVNDVAVETAVADALTDALPSVDVAVANVLLRPVERILALLDAQEVITSGYLVGERPAHAGWRHVETREAAAGRRIASSAVDHGCRHRPAHARARAPGAFATIFPLCGPPAGLSSYGLPEHCRVARSPVGVERVVRDHADPRPAEPFVEALGVVARHGVEDEQRPALRARLRLRVLHQALRDTETAGIAVDEQLRDVGAMRLVRRRREDDLDRAHDVVAAECGEQQPRPGLDLGGPGLELRARVGLREGLHVAHRRTARHAVGEDRCQAVEVGGERGRLEAADDDLLGRGHRAGVSQRPLGAGGHQTSSVGKAASAARQLAR